MKSEFKKGLAIGLMIYSLGIISTAITHLIFGWSYPHGLPPSVVPILLTLLISAYRIVVCGINLVTKKSETAKGELMVHACAAFLIVLIISMMRIKE